MLARLRAQAQQLLEKCYDASRRGDQATYERCHRAWLRLSRQMLELAMS